MSKARSAFIVAVTLAINAAVGSYALASRQSEAVSAAMTDASVQVSPGTLRYVWLHSNDPEYRMAVDVAVNTACNQTAVLSKATALAPNLLRVDLASHARDVEGLTSLVQTWERFAETEPYFLAPAIQAAFILKTDTPLRSGGKNIATVPKGTIIAPLRTVGSTGGDSTQWHEIEFKGQTGFILASSVVLDESGPRVPGVHCGADYETLAAVTGSNCPIVRADWLVVMMLTTADRGLYYEFRGIRESTDSKVSDFTLFLDTFAGVTDQDVAKLGSDSKVAMLRSQVTAKPRAVLLFSGAQAKSPVNQGLVAITQDPSDDDIDAASDPLLNLAQASYAAIEVFAELPCGLIAYGLYSGDTNGDGRFDPSRREGVLQREAPPEIVADHTIPEPHTRRLQAAISCIRCHSRQVGGQWADGWLPAPNDVQTLLASGLDILGDVRLADGGINRIASLYSGSWDKPFQRARDDHAEALLRIIGLAAVPEGETAVSVAHGAVVAVYGQHQFDLVTTTTACQELGIEAGDDARASLAAALPVDIGGVEDVRIGALKAGLSINRHQWEAVYHLAAGRMAL